VYDGWIIRAVLFDLGDTLFDQAEWFDAARDGVAASAARWNIDADTLTEAIEDIAMDGSVGAQIVERGLELAGVVGPPSASQTAFWTTVVDILEPYPGIPEALEGLREHVRIGVVADGDPAVLWATLSALGLERAFDVVVLTDALDPSLRKPRPEPLLYAAWQLDVAPPECVYIGDRPDTDIAAATAAGMRAIRVRTARYAHEPDDPLPWLTTNDTLTALERIVEHRARSRRLEREG